jgi:DNA methyltransferase 1-associated protein 1
VHPAWNKAESDQLFDLCRRLDLRWPVIHDRFVSATPKPMEQLKERYYDMCNHLLSARAEAGEAEAAGHPLLKYKFDPRQERERKAEFERLYHRSAQEVRDEVQRLEQAKALEAKLKLQKKMAKPGGRASGLAALRASLSAQVSLVSRSKRYYPLSRSKCRRYHSLLTYRRLTTGPSAQGFGGGDDLAVGGLPSLAGLLDEPKKHRAQKMWLRSKDFSAKRPASEKLYAAFEQRMTVSSQSSVVRTRGAHVQCACSSHAAHTLCT